MNTEQPTVIKAILFWRAWFIRYGLITLLALLGGATAFSVQAAPVVGEIIFMTGEVHQQRDNQPDAQRLEADSRIREGDRLTTGRDSHVHLRMLDGAFISVRSESELSIERYRFEPADPERSEARLVLHHGVVRTVTGEIGARHRERFRLNTPVAAIGIRGTDFSVLTDEQQSRLSVRQGGVVMAPLSGECSRLDLGPCEGDLSAELFAGDLSALLEAKRGLAMARVTHEGVTPDQYRAPHPRENDLGRPGDGDTHERNALSRGESQRGAESYEESLQQAERYLARPGLITDAYARGESAREIQPRDRELVEQPRVAWGRWSEFEPDQRSRVSRLIFESRQYAGMNSVFALLEDVPEQRQLPQGGRAHFQLNRYDAYLKRGNQLEEALISHPGLVVDFDQQRFAARLEVHAQSLPGPVRVVGGGNLLTTGHLRSDGDSPSRLEGVLSSGADEAGLLFEYQVEHGVDAVGATHWVLDRE